MPASVGAKVPGVLEAAAEAIGAVAGLSQAVGGGGEREVCGGAGGGGEAVNAAVAAAEDEGAVGFRGEAVAEAEGPAGAEHSAARVVHVERLFQCEGGRGTAEGEMVTRTKRVRLARLTETWGKPASRQPAPRQSASNAVYRFSTGPPNPGSAQSRQALGRVAGKINKR